MPEANKKDSFTFSDKIKSSKPALSPFSKRVSSKIGNNGKPKKTIFERTKRDAPFFVAALLALLLLPFLYKYSGNVQEGPIVSIPGAGISDRDDFYPAGPDMDGQISQLTGRDSISLIKGWGSGKEEPGMQDGYQPPSDYRNDVSAPSYTPGGNTVVNDYQRNAPADTRKAFQRSATKIKELGSASMASGRGGGVVGRWGGSLKDAAKRNTAGRMPSPTKPVSLQPLTAAGKPTRTYFGQGGAAEASRSKNALGKGNAMQALMDAQVRNVDPSKIGGLGTGAMGGGGGGGGMKRDFAYKGITPWWWDLMKTRAQKEWELWFDQKAKLVNTFGDFLQNALMCLLSGNDKNDMGTLFGTKKGEGSEDQCCGMGRGDFDKAYPELKDIKKFKNACNAALATAQPGSTCAKKGWAPGYIAGDDMNFLEVRLDCLSNGILSGLKNRHKGQSAAINDLYQCKQIDTTHNFSLVLGGRAKTWNNVYHAITVRNFRPFDGGKYLCGTPLVNYNPQSGTGLGMVQPGAKGMLDAQDAYAKSRKGVQTQTVKNVATAGIGQSGKLDAKKTVQKGALDDVNKVTGSQQIASRISAGSDELNDGLVQVDELDSCVIYIAEGKVLDWDNFQVQAKTLLGDIYDAQNLPAEGKAEAVFRAFANLPYAFIEGYAMKDPLAKGSVTAKNAITKGAVTVKVKGMPVERLPMKYADFSELFIRRSGNTAYQSTKFKDKEREFGEDKYQNADLVRCDFQGFQITAKPIDAETKKPEATLNFASGLGDAKRFTVKAVLKDDNGNILAQSSKVTLKGASPIAKSSEDGKSQTATGRTAADYEWTSFAQDLQGKDQYAGTVYWTAELDGREAKDDTPASAAPVVKEEVPPVIVEEKKTPEKKPFTMPRGKTLEACNNQSTWTTSNPFSRTTCALNEAFEQVLLFCADNNNECRDFVFKQNQAWLKTPQAEQYARKANPELDAAGIASVLADMDKGQKEALDKAYNEQGGFTMADFVNAVDFAVQANSSASMSKTVACRLARQVVSISEDPKIKDVTNGHATVNMFGTLAVYIGEDSSYFPSLWYTPTGSAQKVEDMRFRGCCKNKDKQNRILPMHHWGSYNVNGDNAPYRSQLRADGMTFPLSALRQPGWDSNVTNKKNDDAMRQAYHNAYQDAFSGSCNYSGTMPVSKVQEYIEGICKNGLQYKPGHGRYTQCPPCGGNVTQVNVGESNRTDRRKNN